MPIVETEHVFKQYKGKSRGELAQVLNGITLKVEEGEFVAIMGPSGSGKTTLLNILSGIDPDYSGVVRIAGNELGDMSGNELALFRRRNMGFVFQDYNLLDSLTLRENVLLPLVLDGQDPGEMDAAASAVLSFFELEDLKDKYPYTVSGGQQQRTAICRAVIGRPEVVYADEPTGNLDSKSAGKVMKCFTKLNADQGTTILMVTHDPFAASFCSRVIFIRDGEISMEIAREGNRKEFFDMILKSLVQLGGGENDLY